jgi:hypothetical protein
MGEEGIQATSTLLITFQLLYYIPSPCHTLQVLPGHAQIRHLPPQTPAPALLAPSPLYPPSPRLPLPGTYRAHSGLQQQRAGLQPQ